MFKTKKKWFYVWIKAPNKCHTLIIICNDEQSLFFAVNLDYHIHHVTWFVKRFGFSVAIFSFFSVYSVHFIDLKRTRTALSRTPLTFAVVFNDKKILFCNGRCFTMNFSVEFI